MRTRTFLAFLASGFFLHAGIASGQPARIDPATGMPVAATASSQPRINPANGLPVADQPSPPSLDPATGMPVVKPGTLPNEFEAVHSAGMTAEEVRKLIINGRYDEALQLCLSTHDQFKTSNALGALMPQWIELGRRFPQAREALLGIRDHDLHEFSAGRGYSDLFAEINSINGPLHQDDSTYALFKTIREQDPELAQQCFPYVEGLLVAKGEYQWCYDHMGDPQGKFEVIHQAMAMQLDHQQRMAAIQEATRKRIAEMNRQNGRSDLPAYSPPDTSSKLKQFAHDNFVGGTRQLIEILVATGHQSDADKIRDQAVAILDDERLKSAVADAAEKVRNLPAQPGKK